MKISLTHFSDENIGVSFTQHGSDTNHVTILDGDNVKSGYHGFTSWDLHALRLKTKCFETCIFMTEYLCSFTHGYFDFGSVYMVDDYEPS